MKLGSTPSIKLIAFFVISILVLFLGYYANFWKVVDQHLFDNFQIEGEGMVIARMVKSSQGGILSSGGLIGFGRIDKETPIEEKFYTFQYKAYLNKIPFGIYSTYKSQIGAQGFFFSALDRIIPFSPYKKLKLFHIFTSLLSSLALSLIGLWFYLEFGALTGIFVLFSAAISQWLVIFSKNLFWSTWAFFLPMILVMFYLRRYGLSGKNRYVSFGGLVFFAVFIKCLFNGYEYITTALVMMVVPFIYYCVLEKTTWRKFINYSIPIILSSLAALLLSFIILSAQIAIAEGSFMSGINHIIYSFEKRTFGDPSSMPKIYAESLNSNLLAVIKTYFQASFFDFRKIIPSGSILSSLSTTRIRFWHLTVFFGILSLLLLFLRKRVPPIDHKMIALLSAT